MKPFVVRQPGDEDDATDDEKKAKAAAMDADESLVAHRKSSPNHPLHRRHYLAPAFCAVEDDWAAKL